jgi:hypothetical protein
MTNFLEIKTETQFFRGKGSQKDSFEANPGCNFFIARDYSYMDKNNISRTSKEYACFPTIDDFLREEETYPKTCYETLAGELVEIYDIDGDFSLPVYQTSDGEKISDNELLTEFFDARMDFQIEKFPDLPQLTLNNFLIKKTDDPKGKKLSFHIIIRNGYKFRDTKHLKKHCLNFKNYCKELCYKVKFDTSIYSKNRVIRMLGHHKLNQPERFSYRYENHTKYNLNCNKVEFFASYLYGDEILYGEDEKDAKDEKHDMREFVSDINLSDITVNNRQTKDLVDLILESIDTKQSPICDEEYADKLNYLNWYKLILTVFNCVNNEDLQEEFTCKFLYEKIFPYYRHCSDLVSDKDKYFEDLYASKDKYEELTINSLHYLARFNKNYEKVFSKEILQFRESMKIIRYTNDLKRARKLELKTDNFPINYIHEMPTIFKKSQNQSFTNRYVENIVNNVICNISNGGDNSIFCRNNKYCERSKVFLEEYTQVKYKTLASHSGNLRTYVKVINENYLDELQQYNLAIIESKTKSKKKLPEEPMPYNIKILADNTDSSITGQMFLKNTFKSYSKPIFQPYLLEDNSRLKNFKNCLNLFTGYPFKITTNVSTDLYKNSLLRENVRKYLCNGDIEPENFDYIEKHTAHMIQKPYERADMAILIIGSQGTGKDLWCNHLSKLIGLEYYLEYAGIKPLFKNFNALQGRKLLTKLNEISDRGDSFENHNLLKEKITAERILIEKKGYDSYYLDNFTRYYGFSQHDNVVMVENTDRRFFMIKTNNEKANDTDYFSKIIKESENKALLQSSFNYYATLDISNFNPRNFPKTKFRDDQKLQSLANHLKFFYYLFENSSDEYKKFVSDVFCDYISWATSSNIKVSCNKLNFTKDIRRLGIQTKKIQINNVRKDGVIITHESLQQNFRDYMKNPEFMLPCYSNES